MRIKNLSLSMTAVFSISALVVSGQGALVTATPEKSDGKTPVSAPTPPPVVIMSNILDRPDLKAMSAAMQEKDPVKKLAALEKFAVDFPDSFSISTVQTQILFTIIKIDPNNKERIYQQALRAVAFIKPNTPFYSPNTVSSVYSAITDALYRAKMEDKAEEIARKGIALVDEINAGVIFNAKYPMWQRLGQIYLRKNDLKKAESYFKQATAGNYEGNASLLGLADIYGKRRQWKQQLDYLIQADAKGSIKKAQRDTLENLYAKKYGSTKGLREILDANYKRANPLPFEKVKYTPTAKRSRRTVLAELFTGSECHPCVTIDTAFEALLGRYNPSDVAVLIYDLHIPGPDPITNPATVARAKYYGASSTPTYFINGGERQTGGGINRKESEIFFDRITPKIDAQLEKASEADLKLSASIENNSVKTAADFSNLQGEPKDLRLYIGLVENEISYMGGNGVRFHPMVVREFGGDERNGFALKDKNGKIEWQFDLPKVSADLRAYLDNYEQERQKDDKDFAFPEKKDWINHKNLSVVAFIQDEKTKNVLQSVIVNLAKAEN